jgi:hypothetical protein
MCLKNKLAKKGRNRNRESVFQDAGALNSDLFSAFRILIPTNYTLHR